MKLRKILSFRNRIVVIAVGALLGALSLLYTNNMALRLREKEQHDVALWAHAMERLNRDVGKEHISGHWLVILVRL